VSEGHQRGRGARAAPRTELADDINGRPLGELVLELLQLRISRGRALARGRRLGREARHLGLERRVRALHGRDARARARGVVLEPLDARDGGRHARLGRDGRGAQLVRLARLVREQALQLVGAADRGLLLRDGLGGRRARHVGLLLQLRDGAVQLREQRRLYLELARQAQHLLLHHVHHRGRLAVRRQRAVARVVRLGRPHGRRLHVRHGLVAHLERAHLVGAHLRGAGGGGGGVGRAGEVSGRGPRGAGG